MIGLALISPAVFGNTIDINDVVISDSIELNSQENESLRMCYRYATTVQEVNELGTIVTDHYMCFEHPNSPLGNGTIYVN